MNYSETISYLMSALPMFQRIGKAAYKPNLDNSRALDLYDGAPHAEYVTVHVAGTNGKGSVSHMLASSLMAAGYKTGLFTSPHLLDFRERIRVNGEMVSPEFVVQYVANHRELFDEIRPSFFEMSAAMAFSYFAQEQVDIAVIEVGMGGRLDSTNIINPTVSIITSIGFDHTAFLGDTLEAIASEKAGIIKTGVPVIMGSMPPEAKRVCIAHARSLGAPFQVSHELWSCRDRRLEGLEQRMEFIYRPTGESVTVRADLLGLVQQDNVPIVLCAAECLRGLGFPLSHESLLEGIRTAKRKTHLLGRWQQLRESPRVICDTGHNQDGIQRVVQQLNETPKASLHAVIGFVNDKDVDCLLDLLPCGAQYYLTQASVPRALEVSTLAKLAAQKGLKASSFGTVRQAVEAALSSAAPDDLLFIGGSTFVVADALAMQW